MSTTQDKDTANKTNHQRAYGNLDMNNILSDWGEGESPPNEQLIPVGPISTNRESELLARAELCRVRPTDHIEKSPTALVIEQGGEEIPIGTLGNISMVVGKAKAKKTFVVSFAIAAALSSDTLILDRLAGTLPEGKRQVIFFDTEQSRYHVLRVVRRICRLSKLPNPENLAVYALRELSPDERLEMVKCVINNTLNLGLVVIDGIRDLAVDPILDAAQSSRIVTTLMQLSGQMDIHIMTVLHQNKGDDNARGHLGTELVNKSETVITVKRDGKKDESIVEPMFCRDREFDAFSFSINEDGLPMIVNRAIRLDDGVVIKEKRKADPATMSVAVMRKIVERVFSQDEKLGYGQLKAAVGEASSFVGEALAVNPAQGFIIRVVNMGWLVKSKEAKDRHNSYKINADVFRS